MGNESVSAQKSAATTDVLLPHLADHFRVTLFSAIAGNLAHGSGTIEVYPLSELEDQGPFDSVVLQLEDSADADVYLKSAARNVSLLWLHDLYRRSGGSLLPNVQTGTKIFFSSERNVGEWNRSACGESVRASYLPYPVRVTPIGETPALPRHVVTPATPLVEDQMHLVAPILAELGLELVWLVADDEIEAARAVIAERALNATVVGSRSMDAWTKLVSRAHGALHFHHSAYGDCGPYVQQSLMSGASVFVSDYSDSAMLPESVAIKLLPGADFGDALRDSLRALEEPSWDSRREAARTYALEVHAPAVVAAELAEALRSGRNVSESD